MICTIMLLLFSNIFMTVAWYGNLKNVHMPLWKAILISWALLFLKIMGKFFYIQGKFLLCCQFANSSTTAGKENCFAIFCFSAYMKTFFADPVPVVAFVNAEVNTI